MFDYLRARFSEVVANVPEVTIESTDGPILLRGYLEGDFQESESMIRRAFMEERGEDYSINEELIAAVCSLRAAKNGFIIRQSQETIGFCAFSVIANDYRFRRELVIRQMYIVPERRSFKLLTAVLTYFESIANSARCSGIWWSFDTKHKMREKKRVAQMLGFEAVGSILSLTVDQSGVDLKVNHPHFLTLRRWRAHWNYFETGPVVRALALLVEPLVRPRRMKSPSFRFESALTGYLVAHRMTDIETARHFAHVAVVRNIGSNDLEALLNWSRAQHCDYVRFDCTAVGVPPSGEEERLRRFGFKDIGIVSFRRLDADRTRAQQRNRSSVG